MQNNNSNNPKISTAEILPKSDEGNLMTDITIKKKAGPKKKLKDPVGLTIKIERELRNKVVETFGGETSRMLRSFLEEAIKDRKIVVFTLKPFL